jgi:hypothetical protein
MAMIQLELAVIIAGTRRVGSMKFCTSFPGAERAHTLHQKRGRKKNEVISRGQPIYQLSVSPKFFSGSWGPRKRVIMPMPRIIKTIILGRAG